MNPIPHNQETAALAKRLVWFEPPEQALADPVRFLAYAFARATHEEMNLLRRYLSDADLREALLKTPPGIIDPRSWCYWHIRFGLDPAPMPVRTFG